MSDSNAQGSGTKQDPWQLRTPPGTSEYQMYRDETLDPPALVCIVAETELRYNLRCIDDLHTMLKAHGDCGCHWAQPTSKKEAAEGTVEAWGRSAANPVGGWYADQEGAARGRSGMYLPPLLETLAWLKLSTIPGITACERCRGLLIL